MIFYGLSDYILRTFFEISKELSEDFLKTYDYQDYF